MDEFIDGWARIVTVIPSAGVSSKKALKVGKKIDCIFISVKAVGTKMNANKTIHKE